MDKIHNIAKNTSYLTIALIFQKIISFSYFTLLARFLGPADLGVYYFAISFTTIFSIFIDLGLGNVLTREVAKNKEKAEKWLGNILFLKLPLAALSILAAIILITVTQSDPLIRTLVYISCASMVLDSFTWTFFSVSRGFHVLKYESIASIVFQLTVLIFGYSALILGGGLVWAMSALVLGSAYNFFYSLWVVLRRLRLRIRLSFNRSLSKDMLRITWPFATYAIFQRLYTYLDSVLLSFFAGNVQVGLYQVAFKIIFALQFLPMAFTASLYPAMSAYWQNNREQLSITFERAFNYLIIISLPIIVGVLLLANKVVLLFKSGYEEAVLPLQITIVALFFIFLNFPIGSLLNACDKQKKNTWNMGIAALSSLALNLVLIPRWQAVGASVAVLFSNTLMFILGLIAINGIIKYNWRRIFVVFLKSFAAAVLMGLVIFIAKDYIHIFLLVPISGFFYFLFLFLLKGLKIADLNSVIKSFKV